jgi:hypothetical protein
MTSSDDPRHHRPPRRSSASPGRVVVAALTLLVLVTVTGGTASPKPQILSAWLSRYPASLTDDNVLPTGSSCQVCHETAGGGNGWNGYGWAIRVAMDGGLSADAAFAAVEGDDSDGDPTGTSDLGEISADTQPGWTAGPNNTIQFKNNPPLTNQPPPSAIVGGLDPGGDPWEDLGSGLAGLHGVPSQTGEGSLQAGTTVTLSLEDAREDATAWLVVGLSQLGLPFKGGVLVPDPNPPGFYVALDTGSTGTIVINDDWPAGVPPGFITYFQWWIADSAGPKGFAASNALAATAP